MLPPNTAYSALLTTAGLACLVVGIVIWQLRRTAAGAPALIALMLGLSWWDLAYALFWAGAPAPSPLFWLDTTYLGVVIVAPAFLVFAVQYARLIRPLLPQLIIALCIEPLLALALMWTDPWHGLFFGGTRDPQSGMIIQGGPVFWANILYIYGLLLTASVVLIRTFRRSAGLYRRQAGMILAAVAIPWLNSIIFLAGLSPLPNVDNTPFAFTLTALAIVYALFRYRLLDIVPVARDLLIESMSDGVLVLDAQNRVVDVNPAAQGVIRPGVGSPIGQPVGQILATSASLLEAFQDRDEAHAEITVGEEPQSYYDLRISPLFDRRRQMVGRLVVWRDITALKQAQIELQKLAATDELTHAYNRRQFLELGETEIRRAIRFEHPLALALLDIDHFKLVNDTYGHPIGDEVLIALVQICRAHIREVDLFARLGGEEFVLLLPETELAQAMQVAERLRAAIAATPIETCAGSITITVSLGVVTLLADDTTLAMLLGRVDRALYAAKQLGRNRVIAWPPETNAITDRTLYS